MKTLSKILIIDTATKHIFLSLIINQEEKASVYQEGINNHSVTIIPLLDEMLKEENISLKDLDEIIIGIGPGSYTGVRIGVTVAKMIGYLNHTTVKTISSLALIASTSDKEFVLPYIDARRGNAFMAVFKNDNGTLRRIEKDCLENIEEYKKQHQFKFDFVAEGAPDVMKILRSDLLRDISDIHELKPNYLRITEAERNKR